MQGMSGVLFLSQEQLTCSYLRINGPALCSMFAVLTKTRWQTNTADHIAFLSTQGIILNVFYRRHRQGDCASAMVWECGEMWRWVSPLLRLGHRLAQLGAPEQAAKGWEGTPHICRNLTPQPWYDQCGLQPQNLPNLLEQCTHVLFYVSCHA